MVNVGTIPKTIFQSHTTGTDLEKNIKSVKNLIGLYMLYQLTNNVTCLFNLQEDYNAVHGGKWTVQNLRLFLEGTRGKEV